MSFTDQKRRRATKEDLSLPWIGYKDGRNFRCYLCGKFFDVGDGWRWVFGSGKAPNFFVCDDCDGDDVRERWIELYNMSKYKCWWLLPYEDRPVKKDSK